MTQMPNRFKAALAQGELQLGLWLALAHGYSAEIAATTGFDWLVIDAEHAPNSIETILAQLQAVAPYQSEPVVRIASNDTVTIKQMLDIGARSLLVPMIEDADAARRAVAATRYPPEGIRGVGSALARAARWNMRPGYLEHASEEICLLVQVESRAGLAAIEDIVAVDGIDGVFIGTADLAADMGYIGRPGDSAVQAAVRDAILRICASGKPAGVLSADLALARHQIDTGARFAAIGTDVGLIARGGAGLLTQFRTSTVKSLDTAGDVY